MNPSDDVELKTFYLRATGPLWILEMKLDSNKSLKIGIFVSSASNIVTILPDPEISGDRLKRQNIQRKILIA